MRKISITRDANGQVVCPRCYGKGWKVSRDDTFVGNRECEVCEGFSSSSCKAKALKRVYGKLSILIEIMLSIEGKSSYNHGSIQQDMNKFNSLFV